MNDMMIQAKGLSKSYKKRKAVDGVDLAIGQGRIVGLIGPNGSGKTTTINALLGLTSFEGELSVMGLDPRKERMKMMEDVCFISDVAVLPSWISVEKAVAFVAGVHPGFSEAKAWGYLAKTTLDRKMKVKAMSKGMVVQLHLALIMAINAKLLVLDEPTLGLDLLYRKQFFQSLVEDYFDENKTIVITTHQLEEVEHLLTDIVFLNNGRVVLNESVEKAAVRFAELKANTASLEQARKLGPIHETALFGQHQLIFDGIEKSTLANFGEVRDVRLSDLFVALMKGKDQ